MTKRLRNIFDQYSQTENHLTNSLLLVLNNNRNLLRKILKANGIKMSGKQINLLSQVAPRSADNKTSVPDGYIFTEDYGFCVGVETKIEPNALKKSQLQGHLTQLSEYDHSYLLVLTPDEEAPKVVLDLKQYHSNLRFISWIDLIKMMSREGSDKGKNPVGRFVYEEFISFMERQYDMVPFTGFNFREGYDPGLATHYVKRVSKILTPEIRKAYPKCKHTRPKIGLGRSYPWEAWYPEEKVQNGVHFTMSVQPEHVRCMMILANKCREEWKNFRKILESKSNIGNFRKALRKIYKLAPKGSETMVSFRQRHYIGQTIRINDAATELNVAMLLGIDKSKENRVWWNLLREISQTKTDYNYQLEIAYKLPYAQIPVLRTAKAEKILL
jgi:hypothetical protein